MIRVNRVCRGGGGATDFILLAIFLILAYVFIQRKGYMSKVNQVIDENAIVDFQKRNFDEKHNAEEINLAPKNLKGPGPEINMVDERIQKIPDTRPKQCQDKNYGTQKPVSLILDFFDYQFYDLKTTLGSVFHNTKMDLILEILVIDDGSTLDYIRQDATAFIDAHHKARIIRLDTKTSTGSAKMVGAQEARSDILVFLDTNVIVNKGWLEPLMAQDLSSGIIVPHFDNINDPVSYEYLSTSNSLISGFSWSFTMRMVQGEEGKDIFTPIHSPVLKGNVFLVNKKYFYKLGGFDDSIDDVGGQILELSFRTWLCGGSIKIVPCSRVGLLNLNDPVKVGGGNNVRRISELWLGDNKALVYRNTGSSSDVSSSEQKALSARRSALSSLTCKDFSWYLENIATNVYTPSSDARFYGLLKCKTGRCARIGADLRVDLGRCKPEEYSLHTGDMMFEINDNGLLKTKGKCLAVQGSAYVVLEDCDKDNTKQIWDYAQGGQLKNKWSNYCAMHVTDPDKNVPKGRQILMAQDCSQDTSGEFSSWDLILP